MYTIIWIHSDKSYPENPFAPGGSTSRSWGAQLVWPVCSQLELSPARHRFMTMGCIHLEDGLLTIPPSDLQCIDM
jgi:hypothetical protein